jgi:hypothetical protein
MLNILHMKSKLEKEKSKIGTKDLMFTNIQIIINECEVLV